MDIRMVSPGFAVAPQVQADDMAALAEDGFVAVICNRPEAEETGQPGMADLRAAAEAAGLAFHHIPVAGGAFPKGAIAAFRAVRQGTKGPVLAYCRTGTRSITLETLANPQGLDPEERLKQAANAGYDLSGLSEALA